MIPNRSFFPLFTIPIAAICLLITGCNPFGASSGSQANMDAGSCGVPGGTTAVAGPISFRIVIPNSAVSPSMAASSRRPVIASVLPSNETPPTVTFKLTLVNVGNQVTPTTTLMKTVSVNASHTAEVTFANLPLLTCVGDIHIEGGRIGSYSDFHGALDLASGVENIFECTPKNLLATQSVVAEVVMRLVTSETTLSKLLPRLAEKVRYLVEGMDLTDGTAYDKVISSYLAWYARYRSALALEVAGPCKPFALVTVVGGSVPDGIGSLIGMISSYTVDVEALPGGRLRFMLPFLPPGSPTFQIWLNGATQTVPISVSPTDGEVPASVTTAFVADLEAAVALDSTASDSALARQLIDDFKTKVSILTDEEKKVVALFVNQLPKMANTVKLSSVRAGSCYVTYPYFLDGDDYVEVAAEMDAETNEIKNMHEIRNQIKGIWQYNHNLDYATSIRIQEAIQSAMAGCEFSMWQKTVRGWNRLVGIFSREEDPDEYNSGFSHSIKPVATIRPLTSLRKAANFENRSQSVDTSQTFEFMSGIEYVASFSVTGLGMTIDDLMQSDQGPRVAKWLSGMSQLREELIAALPSQTEFPKFSLEDLLPTIAKPITMQIDPSRFSVVVTTPSNSFPDVPWTVPWPQDVKVTFQALPEGVTMAFSIVNVGSPPNFTYDIAYDSPEGWRAVLSQEGRIVARFTTDSNRILTDHKTSMQWYVATSTPWTTTWEQWDSWAKNLTIGGGGWRLATIQELRTLYGGVGLPELFGGITYSSDWVRNAYDIPGNDHPIYYDIRYNRSSWGAASGFFEYSRAGCNAVRPSN